MKRRTSVELEGTLDSDHKLYNKTVQSKYLNIPKGIATATNTFSLAKMNQT